MILGVVLASGNGWAEPASQYNMSLQDKVITGPKGSLTSPQAASVNRLGQSEEKNVRKIADGIYSIAGWGIGNIIAVEAPEGWIIVDVGDYLEVAQEQRRALENKVDISPISKTRFSSQVVDAMGGTDKVLENAKASNAKKTLEGWQWSLSLTSRLLQLDNDNVEAKAVRAEAARALGQRTNSANARGFYISEALLHEGKIRFGEHAVSHYQQMSQVLGAVTPTKAASPLNDNAQYLRYEVDPRLAKGKRAEFNVEFTDENVSYAIALRNDVVAVTDQPNQGPTIKLGKNDWSQLITGEKNFVSLHASLSSFDEVIGR